MSYVWNADWKFNDVEDCLDLMMLSGALLVLDNPVLKYGKDFDLDLGPKFRNRLWKPKTFYSSPI